MKSFLKNTISSCLGTFLGLLLLLLIAVVVVKIYISKDKPNQKGVLYIPMSGQITDFGPASFDLTQVQGNSSSTTLWDLRNKIKAASEDKNISAIALDLKQSSFSQASTMEIIST